MSFYVNPHGHSCPWYPAAELFGSPNVKWCEETLCHWVSEPANTWSNLLYVLISFYIYWSAKKTKQPELIWLGPAMFIMGSFSLIYHLSNNYFTQVLDFVGMYAFVFWLIILNFRRLNLLTKKNQVFAMTSLSVASTVLVHLMYINFLKFQIIIALAVLTIFITEYMCYRRMSSSSEYHHKFLISGVFFVGLAQLFSQLDLNRIMCDPQNHIVQGHAIWHVLGAVGLTLAYKHYEQFNFQDPA
jgi:hypothetical protein